MRFLQQDLFSKLIFIMQTGVIYFFNNFNIFYEIHPFFRSYFWIEMVGVSLIIEERIDQKVFYTVALS